MFFFIMCVCMCVYKTSQAALVPAKDKKIINQQKCTT